MKLNILGQEYELVIATKKEYPKLKSVDADGLAELYSKKLIINKSITEESELTMDNIYEYESKVIRHEIIHAYFHEAGLTDYCNDELLVDWLALQIPKIMNTIEEVEHGRNNN